MANTTISISLRTFFADIPHNIRVFASCDLLGNFARAMVQPYASLYILALGGNTAQIGLIQSLIPLMGLVILPIAGYLAGRTNRVRLIILSNTMLIINVLIMAFAPTWQVYAVATALMGLAAFQFPARSSLVADSMQPGQRGKGFATLNTISNSLAIVAPFIAGSVITIYGDLRGMRLLLISMAALYGTATLIHYRFLRDIDVLQETGDDAGYNSISIRSIAGFFKQTYATIPGTLRALPTSLKALAGVIVLSFMANGVASPFWVVYATEEVGLSSAAWGLVLLIETAFRLALFIPAGMIVDRWGRSKTLLASLTLALFAVPSFVFVSGFASALMIRSAVAVSFAMVMTSCTSLMADTVPRRLRGQVMSALGQGSIMIGPAGGGTSGPSVGYVAAIPLVVSSLLGGMLYTWSPVLPWVFVFCTTLLSILLIVFFIRDPQEAEV